MKTIFKNENKHLVACLTPDTDTEWTIIQHLYESGYVAKINNKFVVTITETNIDLEEEMYKKIIAIVTDYGVYLLHLSGSKSLSFSFMAVGGSCPSCILLML